MTTATMIARGSSRWAKTGARGDGLGALIAQMVILRGDCLVDASRSAICFVRTRVIPWLHHRRTRDADGVGETLNGGHIRRGSKSCYAMVAISILAAVGCVTVPPEALTTAANLEDAVGHFESIMDQMYTSAFDEISASFTTTASTVYRTEIDQRLKKEAESYKNQVALNAELQVLWSLVLELHQTDSLTEGQLELILQAATSPNVRLGGAYFRDLADKDRSPEEQDVVGQVRQQVQNSEKNLQSASEALSTTKLNLSSVNRIADEITEQISGSRPRTADQSYAAFLVKTKELAQLNRRLIKSLFRNTSERDAILEKVEVMIP